MRCIVGREVAPAGERELDLAVVHLGDQRPPAFSSWNNLTSDDLRTDNVKEEKK